MLYAIVCHDRKDAGTIRADNRPLHLEFLKEHAAHRAHAIGPMLGDDETSMVGSILILDFDNKSEAEAFAAADPYAKAGLFESVSINAWKQVLPAL